jgi:hypothetical protein
VQIGRLRRPRVGARLAIPADLPATLGCDAVGMPTGYGKIVMDRLPRIGCVFADSARLWWIVPSGSDTGIDWPWVARYSVGAHIPGRARLIHRPEEPGLYTPPIPLYVTLCHVAGVPPVGP